MWNRQQSKGKIYNNTMITEDIIFELLGVTPETSIEDIMRAYRKAVLGCHPDCCPDDPRAARRFHRITQVYRVALNSRCKGIAGHKFTPQEMAMKNWTKPFSGFVKVRPGSDMSWLNQFGARKFSLPTTNENLLFVCFWAIAMVITFLMVYLMSDFFLGGRSWESLSALEVMIFAMVPLGIYVVSVTATIIAIILTRQAVYLVSQIRLACQRALPSGRTEAAKLPKK
ncbi:MAG: J domain-containing protein [Phycisphaerae bacterium]|nr:J domain-containing protein [Phycisphaerae bacterium]